MFFCIAKAQGDCMTKAFSLLSNISSTLILNQLTVW